jgi:hypothetical protein
MTRLLLTGTKGQNQSFAPVFARFFGDFAETASPGRALTKGPGGRRATRPKIHSGMWDWGLIWPQAERRI